MLVESIISANYFSHKNLVKRKEDKDFDDNSGHDSVFGRPDAYIPSNPSKNVKLEEEVKAKDISEIKKRIASGFYESSAVNDDLTEAFSEIFKKVFS